MRVANFGTDLAYCTPISFSMKKSTIINLLLAAAGTFTLGLARERAQRKISTTTCW
jgi:hypothetical protein